MRTLLVMYVSLFLLGCGTAATLQPPPAATSPPVTVVTPQPQVEPTQPPTFTPLTSTPLTISRPTAELLPNPTQIPIPTSVPSVSSEPAPTPTPAPDPTAVPVIAVPTPGSVQEPEPAAVVLTPVQEYAIWCSETQEDLATILSGSGEATWGEFQVLIGATQRAYESVDPPPELQAYHDFTTKGFGDLMDMVVYAYQAVNLEGVPLDITEGTVLVEDDLLAVVVLFTFEKMDSGEMPAVDPWPTLPASIQDDLKATGCVMEEQVGF